MISMTDSPILTSILLVSVVAAIYFLYNLYLFCCKPIKRDLLLMRGDFLLRVVLFVVSIPLSVFLLTVVTRYFSSDEEENINTPQVAVVQDSINYTPANSGLVYDGLVKVDGKIEVESKSGTDTSFTKLNFSGELSDNNSHEDIDGSFSKVNIYEDKVDYLNVFWLIYYHFIDPGNQHADFSYKGRLFAAIIAILGVVFMNGLLVSSIIGWFDQRKEKWSKGGITYSAFSLGVFSRKKFALIIGANETAPTIIGNLLDGKGKEKKLDYVILLTNSDVEEVRRKISSYLKKSHINKLIIYRGELDSLEEIYRMKTRYASEIYILGECTEEENSMSYHDTCNMKCVHNIASYLTDKCVQRRILCRVLFEYQTTYSVFQFSDLPQKVREHLVFVPINNYENWAQRVFVDGEYVEKVKKILPISRKEDINPTLKNKLLYTISNHLNSIVTKKNDDKRVFKYRPLEGTGILANSKDHVHLVVIGMSKMGVAMAIQAAQLAHYANFKIKTKDDDPEPIRTRITFIDTNADKEMSFFKGRFQNLFALSRYRYIDASIDNANIDEKWQDPILDPTSPYKYFKYNFIDVEWEFIKGDTEQSSVVSYLREAALEAKANESGKSILTVAVCLPKSHQAVAASLYMPMEIYEHAQQVLVYQREASDIIYNLCNKDDQGDVASKRYQKLRPFGMQYAEFSMMKAQYHSAQLTNYVYTLLSDEAVDNDSIGDKISEIKDASDREAMVEARTAWKSLSIFDKWSNKYLSNSFKTKLRSVGCKDQEYSLNYAKIKKLFSDNIEILSEVEHNRWNTQQLLMGFRAYTEAEYNLYIDLKNRNEDVSTMKRRMKKGTEKAHLNICPYDDLDKVDVGAKDYDRTFIKVIPNILLVVENITEQERM